MTSLGWLSHKTSTQTNYWNGHAPLTVMPIYGKIMIMKKNKNAFFFKIKICSNGYPLISCMTGLEKCCIASACLQWLFHSGERAMASGPLVSSILCSDHTGGCASTCHNFTCTMSEIHNATSHEKKNFHWEVDSKGLVFVTWQNLLLMVMFCTGWLTMCELLQRGLWSEYMFI